MRHRLGASARVANTGEVKGVAYEGFRGDREGMKGRGMWYRAWLCSMRLWTEEHRTNVCAPLTIFLGLFFGSKPAFILMISIISYYSMGSSSDCCEARASPAYRCSEGGASVRETVGRLMSIEPRKRPPRDERLGYAARIVYYHLAFCSGLSSLRTHLEFNIFSDRKI